MTKKDILEADLKKIGKAYGLEDWVRYMRSPWRIIWTNFLAGLFRGIGVVIGMTLLLSVVIWMLAQLVDFPLIGEQLNEFKQVLENFNQSRLHQ